MANGVRKGRLLRDIERHKTVVQWSDVRRCWHETQLRLLRPRFWDYDYTALPRDVWLDILQYSGIDKFKYVLNQSDCDKFAMGLKAMTALKLKVNGIVLVADYDAGHAYCALQELDKGEPVSALRLPIMEPQSDAYVSTASPLYSLANGEAIL